MAQSNKPQAQPQAQPQAKPQAQPAVTLTRSADDDEWGDELPQREGFSWDSIGKSLTGVLIELVPSDKYPGVNRIKVLQDDQQMVIASCPVRLQQQIDDHQLLGQRVKITYVDNIRTQRGNDVKDFRVQLRRK